MANAAEPELGTAQPKLFSIISRVSRLYFLIRAGGPAWAPVLPRFPSGSGDFSPWGLGSMVGFYFLIACNSLMFLDRLFQLFAQILALPIVFDTFNLLLKVVMK